MQCARGLIASRPLLVRSMRKRKIPPRCFHLHIYKFTSIEGLLQNVFARNATVIHTLEQNRLGLPGDGERELALCNSEGWVSFESETPCCTNIITGKYS